MSGPDHRMSSNPKEFKALIENIQLVKKSEAHMKKKF